MYIFKKYKHHKKFQNNSVGVNLKIFLTKHRKYFLKQLTIYFILILIFLFKMLYQRQKKVI